MTDYQGSARPLYADAPDPQGYAAVAGGQPAATGGRPVAEPYRVVNIGPAPASRRRVVLFTIKRDDGSVYEGSIPDPMPAKHYAQLLLDVPVMGVQMAESIMLNKVMGEDNLRALAAADGLDPVALQVIMTEAYQRAMGPFRELQQKN